MYLRKFKIWMYEERLLRTMAHHPDFPEIDVTFIKNVHYENPNTMKVHYERIPVHSSSPIWLVGHLGQPADVYATRIQSTPPIVLIILDSEHWIEIVSDNEFDCQEDHL